MASVIADRMHVGGTTPSREDWHFPYSTVSVDRDGRRATVRMSGDLTWMDAEAVERRMCQLVRGGVTEILVDLSDVHELDIAGIAVLVLTGHRLRAAHGTLRLGSPSAACDAVLSRFHVLTDDHHADL
jgi:anti-anti-sigma factor